jgi:energy-coupling factor transport system ATP-binding protein
MIRLEDVRLLAPGRGAALLDGVDLSIRSSESVAVAGPNGAGKSLLLQTIAGLRPPSSGRVTFDESDGPPAIALVFQSPDDQIVGSTVERDLAFGLENAGLPPAEIRRRVDEALAWSRLGPLARQPPHLLSEGEKQRLALTSALILRPSLLLLDEPTARLDPAGRRLFLDAVRRVRDAAGTAVVHVTHRSADVLAADRVVGMARGRVAFDGTPAELLASGPADALGIVWSGLHRLRRALAARGVTLGGAPGAAWNDVDAVIAAVGR